MTFPASPTNGQQATEGGRLYQWNGAAWDLVLSMSAHAATHAAGSSDPITITSAQVSDFATAAAAAAPATTNASLLTSGTLGDARLSANVVLATDYRLTDSRTPTTHASSHATGGTDAITAASIGAAATSHTHAASDITSGTLADARLSSNVIVASTLVGVVNSSTTAIDVVPRTSINTNRSASSGANLYTWFTAPISLTVNQISMASSSTSFSGITLVRMGLYTWDGTTLTLVARTSSDSTIFAAQNTIYTRSFDTAGGYPSTYSLVAGTRYAIGVCVLGTSPGTLMAAACPSAVGALSPRLQGVRTGNSDLLATNATFNGTIDTAIWARLS